MQWTDRIRQVKIMLVVMAIIIAVTSLLVSHYLVKDLSNEERNKMETWAEALRVLSHADETTDLSLVLNVMQSNNTIPVVVMNAEGKVTDYRNIELNAKTRVDSLAYLVKYGHKLYQDGRYIKIYVGDSAKVKDYQLVCFDESILLKRLSSYPYWQLGIVMIFVVVAIFALLSSKKAEQNKVWVGLSKETAHQLGTPISSLMAWDLIPEMDKDVKRLERIAERFSKIGSLPEPKEGSMNEVLEHVIDYMDRRTSKKVEMIRDFPAEDVIVRMNSSLFEWVIENLCKNAVDAMEGKGRLLLTLKAESNIRKRDIKNVFTPGFTTKQRGWGLGLSLARRIVEDYHKGRIFVKSSEVGKGTTFRIEMPR